MENIELRNEINRQIPSLETKFWSYHTDAVDEMRNVVWTYIHPNIRNSQPLAFACRSRKDTGVYEIYVNPNIPYECSEPLELHEFGHVIFTHMSLLDSQRKIIIQKIMSYWNRFEKHIESDALKTKEDIKNAANVICNAILNVAMDYEVNSKLFTIEERPVFEEYMNWANIKAIVDAENTTKKELENVQKWLKKKPSKRKWMFSPCFPSDEGFPDGLDYRQYVDLMLMKPDSAMDALKNLLNNMKGQSFEDEDSMNVKGNGAPKISKEDLDKLLKSQSDANNSVSNDAKDQAEEQDSKEKGTNLSPRAKNNTNNWSPNGHTNGTPEAICVNNHKRLKRKLISEIMNKHIILNRLDNMYYYNRRKYKSNLLISKNKSEDLYRPGNVYLLVDCSGSIGSDTISKIIGVVKDISKKCGPKSRIIWWDTDLCGDYPIRAFKGPSSCGGTQIWKGINYVKEKYLKKNNDKLIVLSDYKDSLYHWYESLIKIKSDCLGICWGVFNHGENVNTTLKECCCTYDDSVNEQAFFNNFIKKLPTTLVDISPISN